MRQLVILIQLFTHHKIFPLYVYSLIEIKEQCTNAELRKLTLDISTTYFKRGTHLESLTQNNLRRTCKILFHRHLPAREYNYAELFGKKVSALPESDAPQLSQDEESTQPVAQEEQRMIDQMPETNKKKSATVIQTFMGAEEEILDDLPDSDIELQDLEDEFPQME